MPTLDTRKNREKRIGKEDFLFFDPHQASTTVIFVLIFNRRLSKTNSFIRMCNLGSKVAASVFFAFCSALDYHSFPNLFIRAELPMHTQLPSLHGHILPLENKPRPIGKLLNMEDISFLPPYNRQI